MDLPVRDSVFLDNTVTLLRDDPAFGVDITGDGPADLTSNRFAGFTVEAPVQQTKTTGITVNGGVSVAVDGFSAIRVGLPITISHAGAAGVKTTFRDARTRGGRVGFNASSVDAAKDQLTLVRGDFQGASYANIAISAGEDATLIDTPRIGNTLMKAHTLVERRGSP